jgi:hypothetical protein
VSVLAEFQSEIQAGGQFRKVSADTLHLPGWARFSETGAPWIARQTFGQVVACGGTASFSITPAQGYEPLTYQWRKEGLPITPGSTGTGSTITSDGPSLTILNVGAADAGDYDCVLSNECGSATSAAASLTVTACSPADFDQDGDVDGDDLTLLGSCKTRDRVRHSGTNLCRVADLDDDNDVDPNDFGIYQRCYSGANVPAEPSCAE